MFTKRQLRDAMKRAHWAALHFDKLEYRVVARMDKKLEVQEWVANSNSWYQGQHILKCYTTSPSIWDYFPEGKPDAIGLKWLQGEFIRNQLDYDVEDAIEMYEQETGIKIK